MLVYRIFFYDRKCLITYPINYVYNVYLGNVRLPYKSTNTTGIALQIVEENNYYPFGLKHKGYNNTPLAGQRDHKYGFGGKEEQNELGLDWIDITARNYDPALGRWMNVDPLAESFSSWSPYNYVYNNPLNYTDSTGMCPDGDCPDVYGGTLDTVTITVSKSRKNFDYSEMPGNMRSSGASEVQWWNSSYDGTLQQYNNEDGTNYCSHNPGKVYAQWAYQFHYKPRKDKYMADFYKGRGEMSRGAVGIIALGVSPILAAEAVVAGGWFYSNVAQSVALREAGYQGTKAAFNSYGNVTVHGAGGRFVSHPQHMKPLADGFNYIYGLNPAGMATATTPLNYAAFTGIPAVVKWGAAGAGSSAIIFSEVDKLIESRKSSTKQ